MSEKVPRPRRPLWVRFILWGIPGRGWAWGSLWLCVAIAAGCVAYGSIDRRFYLGGFIAVGAIGYYLAIEWEDSHGDWEP